MHLSVMTSNVFDVIGHGLPQILKPRRCRNCNGSGDLYFIDGFKKADYYYCCILKANKLHSLTGGASMAAFPYEVRTKYSTKVAIAFLKW